MAQDPRIDAYIAKAAPFAQPILTHVRALVHATIPDLDETLKWSMPHFVYKGKNLAGFAAFKAHMAVMIHGDGRQGDAMGQYGKIAQMADLPADAELAAKLLDAKARIDTEGTALKPKPHPKRRRRRFRCRLILRKHWIRLARAQRLILGRPRTAANISNG